MGCDFDLDELRVLPTVRDPGLAAVRARALVGDRLLLANGQLGARRAAVRRRSRAAPPASTGCRRLPLAAVPEQLPGKPAAAGLQTLVLCRFSERCFASLFQSQRHRPAESSPPFLRVATKLLRFIECALQRQTESRILPECRSQSLAVARQPGKCACRFDRHGSRIQEQKKGVQGLVIRQARQPASRPNAYSPGLREEPATGPPTRGGVDHGSTRNIRGTPVKDVWLKPLPGGRASASPPHDRTLTS